MAGSYPDVPAPRIAYDIDGTQCFVWNGSSMVAHSAGWGNVYQDTPNDWFTGGTYGDNIGLSTNFILLMFPKAMDIDAWYIRAFLDRGDIAPVQIQTSTDTTNGIDGTWTTRSNTMGTTGLTPAERARNNIVSATWPSTKAIRLWGQNMGGYGLEYHTIHLYGEPSVATGDRLEFWHPTTDTKMTGPWFDFGNIPRGSTEDRTFRLKNLSSLYTANSVNVAFDALTDGSPSVPGQMTISQGGAFAAQQTLTSIAPGAISPVLTVRRITPSNAQLSLWTARIKATAASWT